MNSMTIVGGVGVSVCYFGFLVGTIGITVYRAIDWACVWPFCVYYRGGEQLRMRFLYTVNCLYILVFRSF